MGIVLLIIGLLAAGVVADFLIENGLPGGPDQNFELLGGTFGLSTGELVLGAAILGALAITLVALGLGLLGVRWGRRRERIAEVREREQRLGQLETRNVELERENTALRARAPGTAGASVDPTRREGGVVGVRGQEEQRTPSS